MYSTEYRLLLSFTFISCFVCLKGSLRLYLRWRRMAAERGMSLISTVGLGNWVNQVNDPMKQWRCQGRVPGVLEPHSFFLCPSTSYDFKRNEIFAVKENEKKINWKSIIYMLFRGLHYEARLTATSVIRSPCYCGHFFSAWQKSHTFSYNKKPH